LSRPSSRSGSYTGLIGFNPRRLKVLRMSSNATDVVSMRNILLLLLVKEMFDCDMLVVWYSLMLSCPRDVGLIAIARRQLAGQGTAQRSCTTKVALSCIVSKILRDIGQSANFSYPHVLNAPSEGFPRIFVTLDGLRKLE